MDGCDVCARKQHPNKYDILKMFVGRLLALHAETGPLFPVENVCKVCLFKDEGVSLAGEENEIIINMSEG